MELTIKAEASITHFDPKVDQDTLQKLLADRIFEVLFDIQYDKNVNKKEYGVIALKVSCHDKEADDIKQSFGNKDNYYTRHTNE